jgi:ribosomal protein S18 acetylase RimI-like enzyme
MIIQQFETKYLQDVLLLHKTAMEKVGAYKGDGPWDDDLRDIDKYYLESNGEFLILLDGDKLVGMGAFRNVGAHEAEIKRMRVVPELQGRGIGKMVLTKLEEIAVQKGYSRLILETSDKQAAANELYRKHGFVGIKQEIIDGYNCTWYEKKIGG